MNGEEVRHLRVLVHEGAGVVDVIMDDQVDILLGRVLRDLGESKFLRHDARVLRGYLRIGSGGLGFVVVGYGSGWRLCGM
jgi:hypothetical protein